MSSEERRQGVRESEMGELAEARGFRGAKIQNKERRWRQISTSASEQIQNSPLPAKKCDSQTRGVAQLGASLEVGHGRHQSAGRKDGRRDREREWKRVNGSCRTECRRKKREKVGGRGFLSGFFIFFSKKKLLKVFLAAPKPLSSRMQARSPALPAGS